MTIHKKCGTIALVGLANAGKSTFMNAILQEKVSIVTSKAQTTRRRVLGILTDDTHQLIFVDTPGIFNAQNRFDQSMVRSAIDSIKDADMVCVIIDANKPLEKIKYLFTKLQSQKKPIIVIFNKIDLIARDKLLGLAQTVSTNYPMVDEIFMVSALKKDGIEDVIKTIKSYTPQGEWLFEEDQITDLPMKDIACEITREKIFIFLQQEIPYGIVVEHEKWENKKDGNVKIYQKVVVEKQSHKGIVVGRQGQMLKKIGSAARADIAKFLGTGIQLFLQVVVKEDWKTKKEYYETQGLEF